MDFSRLTKYIDSLENNYDIPYGQYNVHKGYEEVYNKKFGNSDKERKIPTTGKELQWIYSMTKVFTCTAAFILIERGQLGLYDPVSKYLPEFENMSVIDEGGRIYPAQTIMQVWHLLSMRSGLTYELSSPSLKKAKENKNATTRELVRAIAKEPLIFDPGTDYNYSLSHDVVAAVIEETSGMSFYEFLKKEIFIPLDMDLNDIGFHPTKEQLSRFAAQYIHDKKTAVSRIIPTENEYMLSDAYESGGAGLFSSNENYMKLVETLANNGVAKNGYRLIKPETIDIFTSDRLKYQTPRFDKAGYGYAHGVRVLVDRDLAGALSAVGEFGWDGAANSYCLIDRKNKVGIVYTTQIRDFEAGYTEIQKKLRNFTYLGLGVTE